MKRRSGIWVLLVHALCAYGPYVRYRANSANLGRQGGAPSAKRIAMLRQFTRETARTCGPQRVASPTARDSA